MRDDALIAEKVRTAGDDNRNGETVDCKYQSAHVRIPHAPAANAAPAGKVPAKAGAKRGRFAVPAAILLAGVTAGGWYGWHWYTVGRFLVETDDAYIQADNVTVSPQVAGYISELLVTDNQPVKKGEVIARINDRVYRAAVAQARAALDIQIANAHNVDAQIARQGSIIEQMKADVESAQAQLEFARQEQSRYAKLMKDGAGTVQKAQETDSALRAKKAVLDKSRANLDASQHQLAVLHTRMEQAQAGIEHAQAALEQAEINLGYTTITAPRDGVVGDRTVRVGQLVQPGTRLLTLVPMHDVYVVANYKETQLADMKRGQPVDIRVDGYPDAVLHGHVDSLSPGSGAQFALLPPENATGNFTKIVQRVPVKIVLDRDAPLSGTLRPGLSVVSSVDIRPVHKILAIEHKAPHGQYEAALPVGRRPGEEN
ncbi:MAG TPA: HlyD family secretion protein [Pseudolabrys sp.]|nr:HlyD family secretion protein [Pseudolabrys sp.]